MVNGYSGSFPGESRYPQGTYSLEDLYGVNSSNDPEGAQSRGIVPEDFDPLFLSRGFGLSSPEASSINEQSLKDLQERKEVLIRYGLNEADLFSKDTVLNATRTHQHSFLKFLPDPLKEDNEIVLASIENDPFAFLYASEKMRNDENTVLFAIRQFKDKGYQSLSVVFSPVGTTLIQSKDFFLKAIEISDACFNCGPDECKKDRSFCLEAVRSNGLVLKWLSSELRKDLEIVLTAIENNPKAFFYSLLDLNQHLEAIKPAVKKNNTLLEFIPPSIIREHFKEDLFAYIDRFPRALSNKCFFDFRDDKEVVSYALSKSAEAILDVSKRLKRDREVALIAVRSDGKTIRQLNDFFDDKEIVMTAIRNSKNTKVRPFAYASDALRDDFEVAELALQYDPLLFHCLSPRLQRDPAFKQYQYNVGPVLAKDIESLWYENKALRAYLLGELRKNRGVFSPDGSNKMIKAFFERLNDNHIELTSHRRRYMSNEYIESIKDSIKTNLNYICKTFNLQNAQSLGFEYTPVGLPDGYLPLSDRQMDECLQTFYSLKFSECVAQLKSKKALENADSLPYSIPCYVIDQDVDRIQCEVLVAHFDSHGTIFGLSQDNGEAVKYLEKICKEECSFETKDTDKVAAITRHGVQRLEAEIDISKKRPQFLILQRQKNQLIDGEHTAPLTRITDQVGDKMPSKKRKATEMEAEENEVVAEEHGSSDTALEDSGMQLLTMSGEPNAIGYQTGGVKKRKGFVIGPEWNPNNTVGERTQASSDSSESDEHLVNIAKQINAPLELKDEIIDTGKPFWAQVCGIALQNVSKKLNLASEKRNAISLQPLSYPLNSKQAENPIALPLSFAGSLKAYQIDTLARVVKSESKGQSHLVALEMGLGKTIVYVQLILRLIAENPKGIHLILVPKVLLGQAPSDIKNWVLHAKAWAYWQASLNGDYKEFKQKFQESFFKKDHLSPSDALAMHAALLNAPGLIERNRCYFPNFLQAANELYSKIKADKREDLLESFGKIFGLELYRAKELLVADHNINLKSYLNRIPISNKSIWKRLAKVVQLANDEDVNPEMKERIFSSIDHGLTDTQVKEISLILANGNDPLNIESKEEIFVRNFRVVDDSLSSPGDDSVSSPRLDVYFKVKQPNLEIVKQLAKGAALLFSLEGTKREEISEQSLLNLIEYRFEDIVCVQSDQKALINNISADRRIVVTNYESALASDQQIERILQTPNIRSLTADEAQRAHTAKSGISGLLKNLCDGLTRKGDVPIRLVTGTPFENNFNELWTLLSLVNPSGFLDTTLKVLSELLDRSIKDVADLHSESVLSDNLYDSLTTSFVHFLGFRTRVLENLSTKYQMRDRQVVNDWEGRTPLRIDEEIRVKISEKTKEILENINVNKYLENEKRVARVLIHSNLKHASLKVLDPTVKTLMEKLDQSDESVISESDYLKGLLESDQFNAAMARNEKVLVFVEHAVEGELLKKAIKLKYPQIESNFLSGKTQEKEKTNLISRFKSKNDTYNVLIISIKAGAVGLNLPEASRVFMMTTNYNPAVEDQAIARAVRVGNTGERIIHRMIFDTSSNMHHIALQRAKKAWVKFLWDTHGSYTEAFAAWCEVLKLQAYIGYSNDSKENAEEKFMMISNHLDGFLRGIQEEPLKKKAEDVIPEEAVKTYLSFPETKVFVLPLPIGYSKDFAIQIAHWINTNPKKAKEYLCPLIPQLESLRNNIRSGNLGPLEKLVNEIIQSPNRYSSEVQLFRYDNGRFKSMEPLDGSSAPRLYLSKRKTNFGNEIDHYEILLPTVSFRPPVSVGLVGSASSTAMEGVERILPQSKTYENSELAVFPMPFSTSLDQVVQLAHWIEQNKGEAKEQLLPLMPKLEAIRTSVRQGDLSSIASFMQQATSLEQIEDVEIQFYDFTNNRFRLIDQKVIGQPKQQVKIYRSQRNRADGTVFDHHEILLTKKEFQREYLKPTDFRILPLPVGTNVETIAKIRKHPEFKSLFDQIVPHLGNPQFRNSLREGDESSGPLVQKLNALIQECSLAMNQDPLPERVYLGQAGKDGLPVIRRVGGKTSEAPVHLYQSVRNGQEHVDYMVKMSD